MWLALVVALGAVDAVDSLPVALRDAWRVVERDGVRPFGTGESDDEIFDATTREVFVYRAPEPDALSRARSVVASILYAHDVTAKWSETRAFRALSAWERNMVTAGRLMPMNVSPTAFLDARGGRSPRWELATVAAHVLVPDELLGSSLPDDELPKAHCTWLSHASYVRQRLVELDPGFAPPLGDSKRKCGAFERWARVPEIGHVELALAAPSARAAGALFGHLFVRVVHGDEPSDWPSLDSRALAFLANTRGALEEDPLYAFKGIFGGYQASLWEKSFAELYREYAVHESREIRRFRLNLSPSETRRLLERLWTTQKTSTYTYFFFRQNCATLLVDLIRGVLDGEISIEHAGLFGLSPTSALDGLTFATTPEGVPRITYLGTLASFADLASVALAKRAALESELARDADVGEWLARANHEDENTRASAYETLGELSKDDPAWAAYWRHTSEIEVQHDAARNAGLENELKDARRRRGKELLSELHASLVLELGEQRERFDSIATTLALSSDQERHAGYAAMLALVNELGDTHVRDSLRLYALVSADQHNDATYRELPEVHRALFLRAPVPLFEQPYVQGFVDLVRHSYVTRVGPASLAAQRAKQKRPHGPTLAATSEAKLVVESRDVESYERAYAHTGIDSLSFFVGTWAAREPLPTLRLGGAGYDEALGDQRRHGFLPHTALTVLKSSMVVVPSEVRGLRTLVWQSETRLVGYRALEPHDDAGPRLGWQILADMGTRLRPGERWRAGLTGGALVALGSDPTLANHVVLSVNGSVQGVRTKVPDLELATPVTLEARWGIFAGLSPMNALRLSASASPRWLIDAKKLGQRYGAAIQLDLVVAEQKSILWSQNTGLVVCLRGQGERQDDVTWGMAEVGIRLD